MTLTCWCPISNAHLASTETMRSVENLVTFSQAFFSISLPLIEFLCNNQKNTGRSYSFIIEIVPVFYFHNTTKDKCAVSLSCFTEELERIFRRKSKGVKNKSG